MHRNTFTYRSTVRNLLLLGALSLGSFAGAAVNSVSYSLLSDGTAGFDPTAGPGFDTGANNQIVRTNDTFTYRIALSTSSGESGITITLTLPKGTAAPVSGAALARWSSLPAYCVSGSSISSDGQTITCVLATISSSGTTNVDLTASVLGTVPNGTAIPAPKLTVTSVSGTAPAPASQPPAVTVSAAPFYDIVVQNSYQGNPRAYGYVSGGGPGNASGLYERPLIGLMGRNPNGYGNKGVEQLNGPVSITVDLSGMPAGTRLDNYHDGNALDGTPAATGSFVDGCGNPATGQPSNESGGPVNMYSLITDTGAASTLTNTVPNGGDCAVSAVSGTSVTLSITGMDTSMTRRPSAYTGTGTAVPATDWWVFNKAMVLWTPISSYPSNTNVNNTVKLGSFSGTSISGQPLQNVQTANDTFSYTVRNAPNGAASKIYVPDSSLPAPYATTADPGVTGDAHVNYMTPGQTVRSRLILANTGTTDFTNAYACDVIDRTVFDIGSNFSAILNYTGAITTPVGSISYGARAAGKSMYFASTDSASAADLRTFNVAGGTSEYATTKCSDPTIQWFSTPAAAEAAGGLVYVRAQYQTVAAGVSAGLYINGLILRPTYAANVTTLTPSVVNHAAGDPIVNGTLLRNEGYFGNTGMSSVDSPAFGAFNDHLQIVTMKTTSRLTKSVLTVDGRAVNASSATSPTPTPAVLPGSVVTYALQPRYSTTFPPQSRTVTVTDILPPGLSYIPGSGTVGGALGEPQIFANDPAPGYTRLVWTYLNRQAYIGPDGTSANLPEIRFNARVAATAANGTTLTNAAAVSGGGAVAGTTDDYDADCTYTTSSLYSGCVKSAQIGVQVQTSPGFRVQKNTPKTSIEPGDAFSFEVSYASFGQAMGSADIPDIIDILPYVGDGTTNASRNFTGRSPASSFTAGAYQLTSVGLPANDPGMLVYYTSAAPSSINNDPRDPSNDLTSGATKWCLASAFGTAGCPVNLAGVTAVRLDPGISSMPADTVYTATLNLVSTTTAKPGDLLNNSVGARAVDLSSTLKFVEAQAQAPVRVVSGSLAGQVFVDVNQNGTLEAGSDTAIAGVCIVLSGTAKNGAAVTASTLTKADGSYLFASGAGGIYSSADCTGSVLASFSGLNAGNYALRQVQPAGYKDGADYAGTLGGTVSNDQITAIPLTVGQNGTGYSFTELPLPLTLDKTVTPTLVTVQPDSRDATGTTLSYLPADQQLVYKVKVTNPGNTTVNNVVLKDPLPAQVSFLSATVDGTALTPTASSPLTLALPALAPQTTKEVVITVKLGNVTPNTDQTAIKNIASVSAAGVAPVNSPEARTNYVYTRLFKQVHDLGTTPGSTIPQPAPPAWTDKTQSLPGSTLEYCIDFANFGTVALKNYVLSDTVPVNTTLVPDSWVLRQGTMVQPGAAFPAPATVSVSGNVVTTSSLTLEPQGRGTLCFRALMK